MDLDVFNMILIAGGTLAIPIFAFIASFFLWPAALIQIYYWYWRRALGMTVKCVSNGNYTFCYTYRGRPNSKPSILMLHGFSAHKDMWLTVVKFLPKNFHLVCVDMPGHEGTTRSALDDFSVNGQVRRIHQFVESINLNKKPFHLVGTSMGGHIAGVYAAQYPSDICSLSLICPAGNSRVSHLLHPLCISPTLVLQGLVDVRIPHNEFYRKLFLALVDEKSRHNLHESMTKIVVPTQIIWGKHDQVLDVSGADVLADSIPGSQVEILENCGHSVVMERPRKTAKLIVDFISNLQNTENNKKHE
ncbi:monoacylglycerol lipase ABHD6 [Bombina bombina]|uniref:monoacylglycerol lipase ABHD6 n=1 Tax=Bombina bombina TaxID=8345 RepID=UPI00235AC486|nr:monoacylglycerol lipase ABHD6 [Bombina bombina]